MKVPVMLSQNHTALTTKQEHSMRKELTPILVYIQWEYLCIALSQYLKCMQSHY